MNDNKIDAMFREEIVDNICNLIECSFINKKSTFIMLDGEWGSGKSFVLNMIESKLNIQNKNNMIIIRYNCWEDSYHDDPLYAILSLVQDALNQSELTYSSDTQEKISKLIKAIFVLLSCAGGPFKIADEVSKLLGYGESPTIGQQINKIKELMLNDFEKTRIILLVDELDRCLPEYAIKVLERLYLFFKESPNFVVFVGNNSNQLIHSVKKIFGEDISYDKYMNKFFDYYLQLNYEQLNIDNFKRNYTLYFGQFSDKNNENFIDNYNKIVSSILLPKSAREREEIIRKASLINLNISNITDESYYISLLELFLLIFTSKERFEIIENEINSLNGENLNSQQIYISKLVKQLHLTSLQTHKEDMTQFNKAIICMIFIISNLEKEDIRKIGIYPNEEYFKNLVNDCERISNVLSKEEIGICDAVYLSYKLVSGKKGDQL